MLYSEPQELSGVTSVEVQTAIDAYLAATTNAVTDVASLNIEPHGLSQAFWLFAVVYGNKSKLIGVVTVSMR
jgi:hypothetical protein